MTRINITLVNNPVDDESVVFSMNIPSESYNEETTVTFKNIPTTPEEIWIGANKEISAEFLWGKLTDIFAEYSFITVEQTTNGAAVYVSREGTFWSKNGPNHTITITEWSSNVTATGLDANGYLINNEIWTSLTSEQEIGYFNLSFENLSNGKSSNTFTVYTFDNVGRVNIAPIVKSMFDYPDVRNYNQFRITITSSNNDVLVLHKTFIRGGERTNNTNINLTAGTILRPSVKLPIWDGYPTDEYYLNESFEIAVRPLNDVSVLIKDFKRVKGCNNLYLRFLNQMGGYSNWLFESYGETESGSSIGGFIRDNKVDDFGVDAESNLSVYSKVSKEYIGLMQDLIVSHEIYAFMDSEWVRITAGKNSIEEDTAKRAFTVRIKFDMNYRFNPSLLW